MASTSIAGLRCEYSSMPPLGLGVRVPRLSWRMESDRRGARQMAYRLQAASSGDAIASGKADLWDSGWEESDGSRFIEYGGAALRSRQRVWWRVLVRDETGAEVASPSSWFETGLLERSDWMAKWICADLVGGPFQSIPCPHLRREFVVDGQVERARLHLTALGCHRSTINGRRTSDEELSPGWTHFRKQVRVSTHDVTALLHPGANAIGVILGDGWYCGHTEKRPRQGYGDRPRLLAQLEVRYADGRETRVVSDDSWQVGFGPILASDLIMGEEYDARLAIPGWDTAGFDASRWQSARVVADPEIELRAWDSAPIRRMGEVQPVDEPRKGARGGWVFDLGQNIVGRVRLRVKLPAGTTLTLRYAERLEADGSLHTANLRTARVTDHYTCRGDGVEEWESHFTFHGFQYVEVSGVGQASRDMVAGVVLHSDWTRTADFSCSDPLVNRLFQNVVWGWKGNSLDVPTDCPQRDERLGWTGDAQAFVGTATLIADVNGFFAKWLRDIRDDQNDKGAVACLVPHSHIPGDWGDGGPGWADAMVICPWAVYERYGDTRLLREHWPALVRWMEQQESTSRDGVRAYPGSTTSCFGDWLALDGSEGSKGGTPHDLIGCAFFAHAAELAARMARALGERKAEERYLRLRKKIGDAFQRQFMTPSGLLVSGTQTAAVLALQFGLVPDALRSLVADSLEADIQRRGMRLSTGFLGTPFLQHVLTSEGRHETAAALLLQTQWPSWLYAVTQGATTIWERWDGWTAEKGFQTPAMNSFNHYAFGAIGEWLISRVAGIASDPDAPGMKRIILQPRPVPGLDRVAAWVDTGWGRVESEWRREGDGFAWDVTVPANTEALARIPCKTPGELREGGRPLQKAQGVEVIGRTFGEQACMLAAGRYRFSCVGKQAKGDKR
jgi:alpha-L-rhamnosidase